MLAGISICLAGGFADIWTPTLHSLARLTETVVSVAGAIVPERGIEMRKKRCTWLLWSIALTISACSADRPPSLADTTAAAIIQERWNEAAAVPINLGPVQFRQANSSATHAQTSEYPTYQAVARMKLINLENDRDVFANLSERDFFRTQAGVQQALRVSLTPAGEKLATLHNVKNSNLRTATFQCGEYRVEKIISNKPLQMDGEKYEKYRVVLGTRVFELKPEFREVCLDHGESQARTRHFRALLKHDPIPDKWSLELSDVGSREFDFESANVPLMLAKLRADRRALRD
jgi:hypothetical protein